MDTPPPLVETPPPVAAEPVAEGGFSVLPLLLGLAGVVAIAAILLSGNGGDDIDIEPITQP
jgi:hypothetical protein